MQLYSGVRGSFCPNGTGAERLTGRRRFTAGITPKRGDAGKIVIKPVSLPQEAVATAEQTRILARGAALEVRRCRRPRPKGQKSFIRIQIAAARLKRKAQRYAYDARLSVIFYGVVALRRLPLPWGVGVARPADCPATVISSLLADVGAAFRQRTDMKGVTHLFLDEEALAAVVEKLRLAGDRFGRLLADLDAVGAIHHPILSNPNLKPLMTRREQVQAVVVLAETLHTLLSPLELPGCLPSMADPPTDGGR